MQVKPAAIRFMAHSPDVDFGAYLKASLEVLQEHLPPIETWEMRRLKMKGEGFPQTLLDRLPKERAVLDDSTFLKLSLRENTVVTLRPFTDGAPRYCETRIERAVSAGDTDRALLAFMQQTAEVCRGLVKRTDAYWAKLVPIAGGATCIPSPPLVEHNSHLVVTTEAEVAQRYTAPTVFWSSGWDSTEQLDDHRLLLRGMDAVCGPEYLAQIIDLQWRLARAAKPKQTRYALPQPEPSELPIFLAGPSRLELVGYIADEEMVEYSCVLSHGQYIPGWEIYKLWDLIQEGRMEGGRGVRTVRIVFIEQWAAEQEKRPLLDIGCHVYHYDADGEFRELRE